MRYYSAALTLFHDLIARPTFNTLAKADIVAPSFWQGVSVEGKKDMETRELLNHSSVIGVHTESLELLGASLQPDLPWCDDHFEERVSGRPMNPGTEWANWRMGAGAEKFLNDRGMFNHNYMERIWPTYAGKVQSPTKDWADFDNQLQELSRREGPIGPNLGIWKPYGDLQDLVILLSRNPLARQAFLPMFFPEDTGSGSRTPCTLGWHFIRRGDMLHMVYYLRSCDAINHWRNDLYMAARLLIWVLHQLRELDPDSWNGVIPGTLTTHITSLHAFRGQEHLLPELAK